MIKDLVARAATRIGVGISYRRPQPIAAPPTVPASPALVQLAAKSVAFFQRVPAFYDGSESSALRIGGAWRDDLLARRTGQLRAIAEQDVPTYAELLAQLFRSELITGLWNYHYFGAEEIVDRRLARDIEDFTLETAWTADDIATPQTDFGEWGIDTPGGIIKYTDPMHASQAVRVQRALRFLSPARTRPIVLDVGSGYGGMARYLARAHPSELTILLLDIPLNLVTAFAYLTHRLPAADVRLVHCVADLDEARDSMAPTLRILCIPTILGAEAVERFAPHVLHNAQSFSEMDVETVKHYLRVLIRPETGAIIETNAGMSGAQNTGNHRELGTSQIEALVGSGFHALARARMRDTRYVTSTYLRSS